MAEDSFVTQLISEEGEFGAEAMQHFSNSVKLNGCGLSYAIVAVIGPQSSGKSTLFNHLFGTNFKMMDALEGRGQTTQGIWIGKAMGIEPLTLVIDVEGSDSKERKRKDDTNFEKRSALFALAAADIVIINMWCHDIGREDAANRPLQRAVFQGMMRLFSPSPGKTTSGPRKTTLLYVIRYKTKTPFEMLDVMLREDVKEIWETLPKPSEYKDTPLSELFNVEVTALPSYQDKEEQFKEEVAQLRQRFMHSISPGGLACDRQNVLPASVFCSSIKQLWERIKQDKHLDLPTHRIMVAKVKCEEIANDKLSRLASGEDWLALEQAVNADAGAVSGFGKSASTILNTYFSEYDDESQLFDEEVRNEKRQDLVTKAFQLVYPCYMKILKHLRSFSFESFKEELLGRREGFAAAVGICQQSCIIKFDQRCSDAAVEQANWDASEVRGKLERDIEAHASGVRTHKLSEIVDETRKKLSNALVKPVETLFDTGGPHTWASIRGLLNRESDAARSNFGPAVAGFELEQQTVAEMVRDLKEYATKLVEGTSRERAGHVLDSMKSRFSYAIMCDKDGKPRVQNPGEEELQSILKNAHHECLKMLSTMAVLRVDEGTDNVEDLLFSALLSGDGVSEYDPLASNTWDQVPPEKTLITPIQCRVLWKKYNEETDHQTKFVLEAIKQAGDNNRGGPSFFEARIALNPTSIALAYAEIVKRMKELNR